MSSKRPLAPTFPLCRYAFADGRHCAQPASPDLNGLCHTHAHKPRRRLRPSNLIRALPGTGHSPADPAQSRRFMDKLPRAFAEGLITRRERNSYRYLHQVMLQCSRSSAEADE